MLASWELAELGEAEEGGQSEAWDWRGTLKTKGGRVVEGSQGGLRLNLFSSTISGSHTMSEGRRRTLMFPKSLASHFSRLSVQPWKPRRNVSSGLCCCPGSPIPPAPRATTSLGEDWTGAGAGTKEVG